MGDRFEIARGDVLEILSDRAIANRNGWKLSVCSLARRIIRGGSGGDGSLRAFLANVSEAAGKLVLAVRHPGAG